MKIILTKNVPKVGQAGQIVDVSDGYGRNFLIAKKLGVLATKSELAKLEAKKAANKEKLKNEALQMIELKKKLEAKPIIVFASADAKGGVNGNISIKQICDAIKEQFDEKIDKKTVEKKEISAFGKTQLNIELLKGLIATVAIEVRHK